MIEFKDFSCYYKIKQGYLAAIDELNMTVNDGELFVLVGPSGSGKSTLLKAILNICQDVSGELLVDGVPAQSINMQDNLFAYVSQEYVLYPRMMIYENIAYPLRTQHTEQKEVDRRVREISEKLGLSYLLNRLPRQLSGGQHQRVAIARALIKHPQYLLMDEPFSNVAPEQRAELRELVRKINKEFGTTVIFVTHDLPEAFSLADRLAVLNEGRLEELGTPMELRENPQSELLKEFLLP